MANDTMTILRFNQASGCHGATCSARWTSRGTGSRAAQGAADRGTVSYCYTVSFWSVEEPQAWDFDVKSQKCLGYGNVHEF